MVHVVFIALGYFNFYARFGVLTLIVSYTLVTIWCSRYRGMRTVFSIANSFYVGCICGVNGYLAQALFPTITWLPILVRIISLILLYFVLKRFGQTCWQMLCQLEYGWTILCLIPVMTGLLTLYVNGVYFQKNPFPAAVVQYGLLVVCGCAYYLMYLFFERVQKENENRHNHRLLELQVSGLQSRMEMVKTVEEVLRIERHDLRHRLQTAEELVARGDQESAMDFLNAAAERLDNQKTVHWCRPPILDAVFASYFDQARRHTIAVEAAISLPEQLPVEEGELAIVIANALENAIHANPDLPRTERKICCQVIGYPNIMLEIINPFCAAVEFDEEGFPLSQKEGHGLGSQSIRYFCEEHEAVCQCEAKEGELTFRLIL